MKKVAVKATSIDAMEKKSVARPIINLFGKVSRKSSSAYREVRIDKNINMEITEENNANASVTVKTMNGLVEGKLGCRHPCCLLVV